MLKWLNVVLMLVNVVLASIHYTHGDYARAACHIGASILSYLAVLH